MFIAWGPTALKEIPNTKLLVSLQHFWRTSAVLEIFDVSRKGIANKIYSFEEVIEGGPKILLV